MTCYLVKWHFIRVGWGREVQQCTRIWCHRTAQWTLWPTLSLLAKLACWASPIYLHLLHNPLNPAHHMCNCLDEYWHRT